MKRAFFVSVIGLMSGMPVAALAQAGAATPAPTPTDPAAPPPHNAALDRAMEDAIPLTPDRILALGQRYRANQQAQEQAMSTAATPVNRPAVFASFAPGQQTNLIETAKGFPTAISFFDNTGAPWPIAWNTNSNAAGGGGDSCATSHAGPSGGVDQGFVVCVPVKGGNTIEVTPQSNIPRGGLLISLQGAPKPLSFMLIPGNGVYDDNLTVRVNEHGPHAAVFIDTRPGAPPTGEPYMNAMLSGIAPASAVPLAVEGVSPDEVRAWRMGKETYIRTRYQLMSPAWDGTESGEDGVAIYALPNTPVVLFSADNRTISASLKEPE